MLLWYYFYIIKWCLSDVITFEEHRGKEHEVGALICSGHQYTSICPNRLKLFTKLQSLTIRFTSIDTIPDGIEYLQNLITFEYSSNNGIKNVQDIEKLAGLKQLSYLKLSFNKLKTLPACFTSTKFKNGSETAHDNLNFLCLKELDLSNNQIKSLPSYLFTYVLLEKLDISDNKIKKIPVEIEQLSNLRNLNCSDNNIKEIPNTIGNLAFLEVFDCSHTAIDCIPDTFFKLTTLKKLNLSFNSLKILSPKIGHLTSLKEMHIFNNQLETFPATLALMTSLKYLYASYNKLMTFPDKCCLPNNIIILDLSHNSIIDVPALVHLEELTDLNISYNKIETLSYEHCLTTKLVSFNMSFNFVKQLPDIFCDKSSLSNVILNNNLLSLLPFSFAQLKNVAVLNLDNNLFELIPTEILGFTKLHTLLMTGNKIMSLCSTSGTEMSAPNVLKDCLTFSPSNNFKKTVFSLINLRVAIFDNNQITEIPSEIKNCINLCFLSFANNQIKKIAEEIGELLKLEKLNLLANELRYLPYSITDLRRHRLRVLVVDENFIPNDSELGIGLNSLKKLNFSYFTYKNQFLKYITVDKVVLNLQKEDFHWDINELKRIKLLSDISYFSQTVSDKQMRKIWRVVLKYFIVCEKSVEEQDSVSSDEISVDIEDKMNKITSSAVFNDLKNNLIIKGENISSIANSNNSLSLGKRVSNFLREKSTFGNADEITPTNELLKNYIKALFLKLLDNIIAAKCDITSLELIQLALTDLCKNKLFVCISGMLEGLQHYYTMFYLSGNDLANSTIISYIKQIIASEKEKAFVLVTNGDGTNGVHDICKWRVIFEEVLGINRSFDDPYSAQFLSANSKHKTGSILNDFFNRFGVDDVCNGIIDKINVNVNQINESVDLLHHICKTETKNEDDYNIYMDVIKTYFEFELIPGYSELKTKKIKKEGVIKILLHLGILKSTQTIESLLN